MSKIRIKNLKLRTIIGVNDEERVNKQDVVINIEFDYDDSKATDGDDINYTVDYKVLSKKIITCVEFSDFFLIETLCEKILGIVMEDQAVLNAKVEVDKPNCVRFADSVSVEKCARRQHEFSRH